MIKQLNLPNILTTRAAPQLQSIFLQPWEHLAHFGNTSGLLNHAQML
jgi:hypothetical protein